MSTPDLRLEIDGLRLALAQAHAENAALRAELDAHQPARTVLLVTRPEGLAPAMLASLDEADGTVLRTTFPPVREWVLDRAAEAWREAR